MREWLNELPREDKRTIGRDIAKVQFGWPVGLPLSRPLSGGLWELRSSLSFGFHEGMLIALHAVIKKARKVSGELRLASALKSAVCDDGRGKA